MITSHTELNVYQKAFDAAMAVFELSKRFPKEETYSLTDQARRASRSVCANIAEGWRKRRYEAAFVSKLSDSESEAAETQVWLQFAVKCGYAERDQMAELYRAYDEVLRMLVEMINNPSPWLMRRSGKQESNQATRSKRIKSSSAPPLPRSPARKGRQ